MKLICLKCKELAVWLYLPSTSDYYYCDSCVPRSCSCNIDIDTGIEATDENGLYYPCCEYIFDSEGFDSLK